MTSAASTQLSTAIRCLQRGPLSGQALVVIGFSARQPPEALAPFPCFVVDLQVGVLRSTYIRTIRSTAKASLNAGS